MADNSRETRSWESNCHYVNRIFVGMPGKWEVCSVFHRGESSFHLREKGERHSGNGNRLEGPHTDVHIPRGLVLVGRFTNDRYNLPSGSLDADLFTDESLTDSF